MLMLDAAGTWRAASRRRVQAETTLEGTVEVKRDIPRKSIRVFDSKSATLSFLFLSRITILLCVDAACLDTLGTMISQIIKMAALYPLHNSIPRPTLVYSGCSDTTDEMVAAAHLQIRSTL